MGVHPAVLCVAQAEIRCWFVVFSFFLFVCLFSDFHVPAPTWTLLLSQEENPAQRPEASEPAHQRQRGAETGRLWWGNSTVTPRH